MPNPFQPSMDVLLGPTLGAFDAKTHFSKILDMVGKGKEFVVTKHGKAVARISPMIERTDDEAQLLYQKRVEAVEQIKANRFTLAEGQTIRDLIEDGRRF